MCLWKSSVARRGKTNLSRVNTGASAIDSDHSVFTYHFLLNIFVPFSSLTRAQVLHGTGNAWRRQWQPTPVLLPGKSHGQRSLVGCSPWGREESDTTERLHFNFSLSCIGEGNGNPLQCSCVENPRDGGAWWAAVCGVAQSWTQLKWLSSSSMSQVLICFITQYPTKSQNNKANTTNNVIAKKNFQFFSSYFVLEYIFYKRYIVKLLFQSNLK